MATESVLSQLGLFNSPEQYQQSRDQQLLEQSMNLAKMNPFEGARASTMYGAGLIGRALGGEDPMLQLISQRQSILRGIDRNDPQSVFKAAQALGQLGDTATATQLVKDAQEAAFKQSQIVKNLREGNAAMLTADQRNFAQARQEGYKGTFNQWLTEQNRSRATNINVPLSTVDKEANLRQNFTSETKPITTALTAADKIEKLLTTQTSLGDIIAKKQFAKVAGDTNISNKDVAELANYGDLGQRLAGTLSQFFEGRYTQGQREEALALVKQLKGDASSQYSSIQKQYRDRAVAEKLPEKTAEFIAPDLAIKAKTALPPEGTRLRNKKTGKIEVVQGGKLVPVSE